MLLKSSTKNSLSTRLTKYISQTTVNKNKDNYNILLLKIFYYKLVLVFHCLTQHISKTTKQGQLRDFVVKNLPLQTRCRPLFNTTHSKTTVEQKQAQLRDFVGNNLPQQNCCRPLFDRTYL